MVDLLGELHKQGVQFKSLTNAINIGTASGQFFCHVLASASLAEFPSSLLFALGNHPQIDIDSDPTLFPGLRPFFLERLLDSESEAVTLHTLCKAVTALGRQIHGELVSLIMKDRIVLPL